MRVVTAKQMKQVETIALEYDLTYARLMENAGSAAAAFIRRILSSEDRNCLIFCGKGNNGGDGFVTARKLHEQGANVIVALVEEPPAGLEANAMFSMLDILGIPVLTMTEHSSHIKNYSEHADIIVDAIYGIGFRGTLPEPAAQCGQFINSSIAAVVALDLPSGIEADTGHVAPHAVKADFTVAFDALKPLHIFPHSAEYCGHIEALSIGIPPEAYDSVPSFFQPFEESMVWEALPPRKQDSHKGSHGKLLALCGSDPYRGAAVLSTLSALRSGVGLCRIAATEKVCDAVIQRVPEAVLLPLPEKDGMIDLGMARPLLAPHLSNSQGILIGCGSGDTPATKALLEYILAVSTAPVIIDADGLNVLARNLDLLKKKLAPVILTPHPGEMAKLCHVSTPQVQENRYYMALNFAQEYGVHVVLKGHETLIATPDGRVVRNQTGNPGLAKAGTGDVLAGIIASLAAQGVSPDKAAIAGVWLHGLAGDRCAARRSQYAMLAHDLLDDLEQIFLENGR